MNVLLSHFCNLLISVPKKWCLQNFCSIKKWMMLIIVDKSIFKIITWPNNLVLITGFNTIIFCCVHFIWFMNYMFSTKMWLWKLLVESWNSNHRSLNETLHCLPRIYHFSGFSRNHVNLFRFYVSKNYLICRKFWCVQGI